MKYLSTLLILVLSISAVQSQMTFDLNSANYQVVSGFWELNVPVNGGVPPLTYSYQALPGTWLQNGNTLNIPLTATAIGGTWAVKVIVTDALNNKLQRTILIKISGGAIYLGDYSYDQTFTFTSTGATSIPSSSTVITSAVSSSSSTVSSSSGSSNSATSFGSTPSTAGVIPLQSSSPGQNTPLPTSSQLDSLINSGDIVSITQTVQQVISSSLSCTQKSGYLNDFLGRIQSYITIKGSQADQLGNIISNTQAQINSLNAQIANFSISITNLGVPALQFRQSGVLSDLQKAYDQYNAANVDLTPYNLNISSNLQSVNNLTGQLKSTNGQIAADNQSLSDTESLIASLEQQLATAKQNKVALQARILQESAFALTTQQRIDFLNADNVNLNNQINSINNNKAILQNNYQSLETQAQNIKNTISAYQALQAQYTSQISILKTQVQQASLNLDPSTKITVEQTIASLNSTIPALKQQIDYVKFNCNGVVNYTVSTLNGTITYTFSSSVFSTYITNEYGLPNSNAASAFLGPISKVTLTPITIFTPAWVDLYGASFTKDISLFNAISSNTATTNGVSTTSAVPSSYFFVSDFSCSSTATLASGAGVISSINSNLIQVSLKTGGSAVLTMGACSNILLLNVNVPKVGNNIYWRGLQLSSNTFQVYSALIF